MALGIKLKIHPCIHSHIEPLMCAKHNYQYKAYGDKSEELNHGCHPCQVVHIETIRRKYISLESWQNWKVMNTKCSLCKFRENMKALRLALSFAKELWTHINV